MACLATLIGSPVSGQDPKPESAEQLPAEIAQDLRDLSSPEFKKREAAGQRLVERKGAAVKPLAALAETGPAEASIRAFTLLRQLYRDSDPETNEAVEEVFESLARNENPTIASRADAAIEAGAPIRHAKAISAFRKLGGIIRFRAAEEDDNDNPKDGSDEEALRAIEYALVDKSWKGGDEGLKYLRRIDDFRMQAEIRGPSLFIIKGSGVSEEAQRDLQIALPALSIQPRGPACLGVTPSQQAAGPRGLPIEIVKRGTAADRAGLRRDDSLISFNGQEIPDFNRLVELIGETEPGQKVPVVYERNGVIKTVTVELRGWE